MNPNAVRFAADWMQRLDLLLALLLLVVVLWVWRRWKKARALLIGLITVAIHGVTFHTATLFELVPSPEVNLWSALLRAHMYTFLLATLLVFIVVALGPEWDMHSDGN